MSIAIKTVVNPRTHVDEVSVEIYFEYPVLILVINYIFDGISNYPQ